MTFLLSLLMTLAWMVAPSWAADVVLSWNPNTESDLAGYKIYQSTVSGSYGSPVATLGKVVTTTLTLPQLTVDTTYFFAITAYDLAGNESGKSAEVSKLVAGVPAATPPGIPVVLVSARTTTSLTVTYAPVPDGKGGVAAVDIRYAMSPAAHWGVMTSSGCAASPCTISGLTPNTPYDLQAVASRNDGGTNIFGSLSVVSTVSTMPADLPPTIPQGLQVVSATTSQVVVVASISDCSRVLTSTKGSTSTTLKRTLTCVK